MRGCACDLWLILGLTSAVCLRSKSHGTYDHALLSQFWDSPNLEGQVILQELSSFLHNSFLLLTSWYRPPENNIICSYHKIYV
jgi:hypothetical protein